MSRFFVRIKLGRHDCTSDKCDEARFVRRNRGLRYPRPCNRAFIARFSRYRVQSVINRRFPRNVSERIKRTNGFRTGCARLLYTAGDKAKFDTRGSRFTRTYSRDTRGAEEAISITDSFAGARSLVILSARDNYRAPTNIIDDLAPCRTYLRNGVSIRPVAANNNPRYTFLVSSNLSNHMQICNNFSRENGIYVNVQCGLVLV